MTISNELQIGKAGEHLVCFDLICKKYNAFLADAGLPYDVLVDIDGSIKKIQVKTCCSKKDHGKTKNVYRFYLRKGKKAITPIEAKSIDYIAFVFLDQKIVQYIPTSHIQNSIGNIKQCIDFSESGNKNKKYIIRKFDLL